MLCVKITSLALGLKCMLKSIHPLEQRIGDASSEGVSWVGDGESINTKWGFARPISCRSNGAHLIPTPAFN